MPALNATELDWEVIYKKDVLEDGCFNSQISTRMKVFKGWLVKNTFVSINTLSNKNEYDRTECMEFVSDPNHDWKIK